MVHGNKFAKTHGKSGHIIFRRASAILSRCNNKKNKSYHLYGGRGIECRLGNTSEEVFDSLMSISGYFDGAQIDRIDNNGHYEIENLRWVTPKENCMNRRNNITEEQLSTTHTKTSSDFKRWCKVRCLDMSLFEREWLGDMTNQDSKGKRKKKYLWHRKIQ